MPWTWIPFCFNIAALFPFSSRLQRDVRGYQKDFKEIISERWDAHSTCRIIKEAKVLRTQTNVMKMDTKANARLLSSISHRPDGSKDKRHICHLWPGQFSQTRWQLGCPVQSFRIVVNADSVWWIKRHPMLLTSVGIRCDSKSPEMSHDSVKDNKQEAKRHKRKNLHHTWHWYHGSLVLDMWPEHRSASPVLGPVLTSHVKCIMTAKIGIISLDYLEIITNPRVDAGFSISVVSYGFQALIQTRLIKTFSLYKPTST